MSCIRSKNTKPEMILRSAIFAKGYRYRLHEKKLPGKPDIIFSKKKVVVFINGCFWHKHAICRKNKIPRTNTNYWLPKLNRNVERDAENEKALTRLGWKVMTIWECEIKKSIGAVISKLEIFLAE